MSSGSFPESGEDQQPAHSSHGERADAGKCLQSWKEVAAYLKRDRRTVQRWEKNESLPVRRHVHSARGSIYAYTADLDNWLITRSQVGGATPVLPPAFIAAPVPLETAATPKASRNASSIMALGATAFVLGAGFWLLRTNEPHPRSQTPFEPAPLTSLVGDAVSPSFTPDGKSVAYAWSSQNPAHFRVMLKAIDGSKDRPVTPDGLDAFSPAVSPDGKHVAFLSAGSFSENPALWLVNTNSGATAKIADSGGDAWPYYRAIAWMPAAKTLVSVGRGEAGEASSLYLYSIDGREKQKITDPPDGSSDYFPSVSPDGTELLFTRFNRGTAALYRTYLKVGASDKPGSERILFPHLFTSSGLLASCWDKSGKTIFLISGGGSTGKLWRAPVRARSFGPPEPIASMAHALLDIAAGSASGELVFAAEASDINLWKVPVTNAKAPPKQVEGMVNTTRDEIAPRYSPDGSKLAFESDRSGAWQIWVAQRDGTAASALTHFDGPVTGSPSWSPDGRSIAFDSRVNGRAEVFTVAVTGGEPMQVTQGSGPNVVPRWSRDGWWIYFSAPGHNGSMQVWKIHPDGSARRQVTTDGGFAADESDDGIWLYYTQRRDAVTSIWRKLVQGGTESEVAAPVLDRCFAIGHKGIYYASALDPYSGPDLEFQAFDSKVRVLIRKLSKPIVYGLALSPDERELTYGELDSHGSDLEIVRNMR